MSKLIDMTGQRFGRLTVVEPARRPSGKMVWLCRCDCGNTTTVARDALLDGRQVSCGQHHRMGYTSPTHLDLAGRTFGKLTVISEAGKTKRNNSLWNCRCECGNDTVVYGSRLVAGDVNSCGCLRAERSAERRKDLSGRRFGLLTAIEISGRNTHGKVQWSCSCDCGKTVVVDRSDLTSGKTVSCGHKSSWEWMGTRFRSKWEVYFAIALDASSIPWKYETDELVVTLENRQRKYHPDFEVQCVDGFIEVKGRRFYGSDNRVDSLAKPRAARKLGMRIGVVTRKELAELCGCSVHALDAAFSRGGFEEVSAIVRSTVGASTRAKNEVLLNVLVTSNDQGKE